MVEEEHDDMMGLITRGMPEEVAKDFINIYELFLTSGAAPCDAKAKVCELFSPPRVTAEMGNIPILNLIAGSTFDLRMDEHGQRWNFLYEGDRRRARKRIEKEKPYVVVGSPPCTFYSILNKINHPRMDAREVQRRRIEADTLLNFAIEIYELQLRGGRHFLHEHPESATSWREPRMRRLQGRQGVATVVGHLCQFGSQREPTEGDRRNYETSEEVDKVHEFLPGDPEATRAEMRRWP